MAGAAEGGHMSIVQMMVERGARDWDMGLWDYGITFASPKKLNGCFKLVFVEFDQFTT